MRKSKLIVLFVLAAAATSLAQLVAPLDMKDANSRLLQQRYLPELKAVAEEARTIKFPYPFYFSQLLDIDEVKQQRMAQSSLRFDRFQNVTVLEITGNYYAAYSAELMDKNKRARATLNDVILPLLKAEVTHFEKSGAFQAYAFEISHHVRHRVMGVSSEHAENVVLLIPCAAAKKLVEAKDPTAEQAALLEGQAFVDAEPVIIWTRDDHPAMARDTRHAARAGSDIAQENGGGNPLRVNVEEQLKPLAPTDSTPARDVSPEALKEIQASHQDAVARLVKELDSQAHFVSYAPPAFIAFHQGAYLQLSINTTVGQDGSRYRQAALAFDDHIVHLIRPVLGYFSDDTSFDGVDFSTTIHSGATTQSVEFIVPFTALRCYERYDCTGQQLINSSFVLINGERAALDLQIAETVATK